MDGNMYLAILHLLRVELRCKKNCTVRQGLFMGKSKETDYLYKLDT